MDALTQNKIRLWRAEGMTDEAIRDALMDMLSAAEDESGAQDEPAALEVGPLPYETPDNETEDEGGGSAVLAAEDEQPEDVNNDEWEWRP